MTQEPGSKLQGSAPVMLALSWIQSLLSRVTSSGGQAYVMCYLPILQETEAKGQQRSGKGGKGFATISW